MLKQVIATIVLTAFAWCCNGQSGTVAIERGFDYRIELNTGETVIGFVVSLNDEWITIEKRPTLKRTEIRRSTIRSAEKISPRESVAEDVFGENPHAESYMLGSSALPFNPEELSGNAHWFLLNQSQYTFNEHLALEATSLIFYPFGLGLKCNFSVDDLNHLGASVNGFVDFAGTDQNNWALGFAAFGRFTHGSSNRNFTIGGGLLGANQQMFGNYAPGKTVIAIPVLTAGFCNRFAERWSVVLEGHVLPDEGLMIGGAGFKFLRDKTSCWTFGCYGIMMETYNPLLRVFGRRTIPLPYFSYARKFD